MASGLEGDGALGEVERPIRVGAKQFSEGELVDYLVEAVDNNSLLEERLAELELALEDRDWVRLDWDGSYDFSAWALERIIRNAQNSYLHNPLINHGVEMKADYVWAKDMSIKCVDEADQKVADKFMRAPRNRRSLTDFESQIERDQQVDLEGNLFVTIITGANGDSVARVIPTLEIVRGGIICNPEDRAERWYYHRVWAAKQGEAAKHDYYPDIRYTPEGGTRPGSYGEGDQAGEIHWDMPVHHIKDGGLPGSKWGVPTVYQSIDWAREVKRDLEAYATIRRALASFAFKLKTTGGSKAISAAKQRLDSMLRGSESDQFPDANPPPAMGSTWIEGDGRDLQPFKTAGTAPSPDEGRRLWLMTGAGMGLPETMLAGDADVGNYATATTLDRPTELMMKRRQRRWVSIYEVLIQYVILKARAPNAYIDMNDLEALPEVRVSFPPLLERDPAATLGALLSAFTYDSKPLNDWAKLRPKIVAKMLLEQAGIEDVDEVLTEFFDTEPKDGEKKIVDAAQAQADAMAAAMGGMAPAQDGPVEEAVRSLLQHMMETRRGQLAGTNGSS